MTAAVLVLAALAVLPMRWTSWAGQFGAVPRFLIAPVAGLVASLTGWMTRPEGLESNPVLAEVKSQRDLFQAMYLQQRDLVAALEQQLDEFRAREQPLGLRHLVARVIGSPGNPGSGILIVKAGKRHGVEPRTVAVAGGAQVVGRIEDVSATTCELVLLTNRASGSIAGVIPAKNGEDEGIRMPYLYPTSGGTLQGLVMYNESKRGVPQPQAALGDTVRLDDQTWPASAQQLVLGTVVSIDHPPESPTRQLVTVRPTLRLDRVTEVTLRLAERREGGTP
ncbi:MAG: hypothetical protein IT437_10410 [Phycisphaerales bacterium]|nr:hypothetical protein [Phycisphaerales bacterium]